MTSRKKVKKQTKTKELPNEIKCFVHRLLILDKRNRENWLININPAAKCRALCPGRISAWHLLPLPKQAGKWERGDQPGQRQWNCWAALLWVLWYPVSLLAGGDSQSGILPAQCISRAGWGLASSIYQASRWRAVGLEVELWPLVCQSEPFQKGTYPALEFARFTCSPYGMALCHCGPQSETIFCDSIP